MNTNNRINTDQDNETFSLKEFLLLCLGYWKWFLASIIIFVGMGLFFVYTRQPQYERSEEILVKDQDRASGVGEISNSFSQLGLFSNNTKVFNELIAFTSPAVMYEVVDRLNLTMNYTRRKGLKKITLYGTSQPVVVEFPDLSEWDNVGLRIILQSDGSFELKKFRSFDEDGNIVKHKEEVSGKVDGAAVKTPFGRVEIKANENYIPNPAHADEEMVIDVFKQSRQGTVESYVAKLKGDLVDQDADVINLSIKDTSIERADAILNTVVDVYNERWILDKNKVSIATSDFISERLGVIESELGEVDADIAAQKSAMGIPDFEEAARGLMQQDIMVKQQLLEVSSRLAMTQFLKDYVQNPAHTHDVIPMNTGIENAVLEDQIGKYNELLSQRNNLAANSSANNPLVIDQDKSLASMRISILRSIESNITNLKNVIKTIDQAQASTNSLLSKAPKQMRDLLSVERQQEVMQELYIFLLQKREENQLSQSFIADNIRVITPPYGQMRPVSPKKALIIIVFFILGFGIPAVALFIAESANTKIRSKKDLENLAVPFAGEIPHIGKRRNLLKIFQSKKQKQKDIDKPKVVVAEGKRDIPNEAFRVVRSNIDFMLGKERGVAIALTSFNPGSGKSFVAYNLGASFALKGKRVLLIDGDLRHGSISAYVDTPRKGLATYLTGASDDWKNLVVDSEDMPNLSVLPIGNRPPNPAELLDNGRLGTLIDEAKQIYDIVLIDCPPINVVVDTQIINQYVSRTLFVVRAGLLEKKALNDLINLVGEKKLNNITVLLNGTKTEFSTYHTYGNYEAIDKS